MIAKIIKIGNSQGIIIPQKVLEFEGVEIGELVKIHIRKKRENEQEHTETQ